jgi:hypothetical protein
MSEPTIRGKVVVITGGLMTDAEDYLQFGQMLLNGGQFNGRRLLSPKTVELMSAVHAADTLPGRPKRRGFGLSVQVVSDAITAGYGEVSRVCESGLLIHFGERSAIPVIGRGDARRTLFAWMEEDVLHPEGLENLLAQELVKALTGGDFDNAAERVKSGAGTITPAGSRLEV